MQNTVRTTIRIRKDLLDMSRRIALARGTNLQHVVNDVLARGFGEITDLNRHEQAMKFIDAMRKKTRIAKKSENEKLISENKSELEKRTAKIIR